MSKELLVINSKPKIPSNWNYEKSVSKIKQTLYKWKNITTDLAWELYIAREILSNQGARTDLKKTQTWEKYCKEIGTERMTVHRWLEKYFVTNVTKLKSDETPELPKGKYQVIYADPPWAWLEFKKYEPNLRVKNLLVWDKQFVGLGWDWRFQYETIFQLVKGKGIANLDKSASNLISAKKVIPKEGEHPTPKSVEIISEILKRKPSEFVLDPFAGSGTTLEAACLFKRKYIGIEIEPKYVKLCEERLRQINNPLF